jgi:hypothetical protein
MPLANAEVMGKRVLHKYNISLYRLLSFFLKDFTHHLLPKKTKDKYLLDSKILPSSKHAKMIGKATSRLNVSVTINILSPAIKGLTTSTKSGIKK